MHWALLLLSATTCAVGQVRSVGPGHITLKVTAAPLSDVLSCLSEATGVEIVYDDVGAPSAKVTVSADDVAISDALDLLLAHQPLKYALAIDPKGKEGGVLIVSAGGDKRPPAAPSTPEPTAPPWDPEGQPLPAAATPIPPSAGTAAPPAAAVTGLPMVVGSVPDRGGAVSAPPPNIASPSATVAPPTTRQASPAPLYPEPLDLTRTR
jgi:hypothetical protein